MKGEDEAWAKWMMCFTYKNEQQRRPTPKSVGMARMGKDKYQDPRVRAS